MAGGVAGRVEERDKGGKARGRPPVVARPVGGMGVGVGLRVGHCSEVLEGEEIGLGAGRDMGVRFGVGYGRLGCGGRVR
jgi:hypothetical protein